MMKRTGLILFVLLFTVTGLGQINDQLCKPNEKIVFACQLKNLKWISVCQEKNGDYIVYRSGTKTRIELQYPANPNPASWQQFTFKGYMRGGGKANAAMHFANLSFVNNEVDYEVYEYWDSEDDKEKFGIIVRQQHKTMDLKGNIKSKKGSLLELLYQDKIKKEAEY